jgi:MYXO-CTERM domain-containing protein
MMVDFMSGSARRCVAVLVATMGMSWIAADWAIGDTVAYWRHEEGPAGGLIPIGNDTVLDSSVNGNHMRTFDPTYTSADYTTSVSPLPLRSGLANNFALNFGPGGVDEDRFANGGVLGRDDDNYTEGKLIQTHLFTAMTVELAFKLDVVSGYQAFVGRDGKPIGDAVGEDDSPVAPFAIKVRGDNFPDTVPNQLFVEWIDGDGTLFSDIHFLATRETVLPNVWYHVAFTLTATDAHLWVAQGTGEYVLKDSKVGQDYVGESGEVSVFDPTPWTIGRGAFGNGIVDWVDGIIDEVRVSDSALMPDQFLFLPPTVTEDADFDNDGDVDATDFSTWAGTFGGNATGTTGDADGDGNSDGEDFLVWQRQFEPPTPGSGAVPEPAAAALALLAAAGVWRRRR